MWKARDAEFFLTRYTPVNFYPLSMTTGKIDEFYMENLDKKVTPPIALHARVIINPPLQLLMTYGIEVQQQCLAVLSRHLCEVVGYTPKLGDRLEFADDVIGRQFRIDTVKPDDFFGNTGYNLHWVCMSASAENQLDSE